MLIAIGRYASQTIGQATNGQGNQLKEVLKNPEN